MRRSALLFAIALSMALALVLPVGAQTAPAKPDAVPTQPDSALAYYRLALSARRARGDQAGEATILGAMGVVFSQIGQEDSMLAYERALQPMLHATGDRRGEAYVLYDIGLALERMGQPDSAFNYLRQALVITRDVNDPAGQGLALNGLGGVYEDVGQPDSALAYYREALRVRQSAGDSVKVAETLANIGVAFDELDTPDSALASYHHALTLARAAGDRNMEGGLLMVIGSVFADFRPAFQALHQLDSAIAYYRQALPLRRLAGDRDDEARTLANIGKLFGFRQPDSALAYFRQAVPIFHDVPDPSGEAITLGYLGLLYQGTGPLDSSVAYFDRSTALSATISAHAGSDLNRVSFNEGTADIYAQWTLAWLSLGKEGGPAAAARAGYAALAASERGRAQALAQLMGVPRDVVPGADLVAEGQALAKRMVRSPGTSALTYAMAEDTLITWLVLPGGGVVTARKAISSARVDTLVAAMRFGVAGGDTKTNRGRGDPLDPTTLPAAIVARALADSGRALRHEIANLLLPSAIRRRLPAHGELVIIPSGGLSLVPFGLLPLDSSGALLGDRLALRYGPSFTAIIDAEDRAGLDTNRGADRARQLSPALVVGDPTMPLPFRLSGKSYALGDLPGAKDEGRAVADSLGASEWLTGDRATEAAVEAQIPSARLVHLATHGMVFSSDAHARLSFVALAPDATHDGHLSVATILDSLNLHAELVVLSACQTAVGDIKSAEGTLGLQRAMLAKGARSVLVSLWNVSDVATLFLVQRFYHHWLHDANAPTKSEALRLAQADVRAEATNPAHPEHSAWSDPFYWAAFQLVGAP